MKLLSYETALSFKAKLCFNAVVKHEDHAKAETNNSSSEVKKNQCIPEFPTTIT